MLSERKQSTHFHNSIYTKPYKMRTTMIADEWLLGDGQQWVRIINEQEKISEVYGFTCRLDCSYGFMYTYIYQN